MFQDITKGAGDFIIFYATENQQAVKEHWQFPFNENADSDNEEVPHLPSMPLHDTFTLFLIQISEKMEQNKK